MDQNTQTAVAEYSATEAALATLRERFTNIVWNVSTTKGLDDAKKARAEIRGYRTSLEAKRQELKAPLLAQGKLLDDEAKRITAELVALEDPIDAVIKAEEKRKAEEKAERERAEAARVATIRAAIHDLAQLPLLHLDKPSGLIRSARDLLAAVVVDAARFAELLDDARAAQTNALAKMDDLIRAAEAREAEQARLAAERDELARRRREQEEQERAAAEARRQQEAADRAARAEADRIAREARAAEAAQLQAERERQEAELRAAQASLERYRAELEQQRQLLAPPTSTPADVVAEAAPAPVIAIIPPSGTVTLRFEGYSDDTFGECAHTGDEYDNCASGTPIEWLVTAPNGERLLVVGQHCPGSATGWLIGVAPHDERPDADGGSVPAWPMRFALGDRPYSPALLIEAPAGVTLRCLQRHLDAESEAA